MKLVPTNIGQKSFLFLGIVILFLNPFEKVVGHGTWDEQIQNKRAIKFPDTEYYKTLTLDPHTHSVFSDGHVWPSIRVAEAQRDGLDALAITEHLEYQPHRADILHPDRNRAFEEAKIAAMRSNLIVIHGSEITRDAPAGHINALFLEDSNKLLNVEEAPDDDRDVAGFYEEAKKWPAQEAVDAAHRQGAFMFWNHPYWTRQSPDGIARMNDFHRKNAEGGKLHGIEVANGDTYSEEAFAIALKYNLAVIGVSDVHNLIDWDYDATIGAHRPVTLVFSKNRSQEGIKEALFDRRTVVWFKNLLIGREKDLTPLLAASLNVSKFSYLNNTNVASVKITNRSDATFKLRYKGPLSFMGSDDRIDVPANTDISISIKTEKRLNALDLEFEVENALIGPGKYISYTLSANS